MFCSISFNLGESVPTALKDDYKKKKDFFHNTAT